MNSINTPLLSVIIPTYKRQHYLSRAIASALEAAPRKSAEVIVVPNGPDESWKNVAAQLKTNAQIKWHPIPAANVSMARNSGLSLARGELIRFLDDDDYLYGEACIRQCEILLNEGSEICSGAVNVVLQNGRHLKTWRQPDTSDFVVAMLCPQRKSYPCAHIFRRKVLTGLMWNNTLSINEDTDWLLQIASSIEVAWTRTDEPVGAWVQHSGPRLSKGHDPGQAALEATAEMIIAAMIKLEDAKKLGEPRKIAAADGLWSLLQKGLMYDFAYWQTIAKTANTYAPNRTPPSRIYQYEFIKKIDPLVIESMLIPVRRAHRPIRRILESLGINRT